MTKEELVELKNRIMVYKNISEEEREKVLKEIENGQEFGFNTGYPTIDRSWFQYYDMKEYYNIKNDKTIYQDILDSNVGYEHTNALSYFGARVSYGQLFKNIDKTAKSLEEYGVKKGDFVTVCCAGIPECVYAVYALAKIGAIANLMAPYFDEDQMSDRIRDCESDTLIVMDQFYPKIKKSIDNSSIKKVIIIPALNASPLGIITGKNKIEVHNNEVTWNQFIKDGKRRNEAETFPYVKDYPLCMVYSSGTTGASKAIVLSHDSFQYSVLSYNANTIDIVRGQRMYQIVPPWYSTGLSTSIHLPLHNGVSIFQDPRFEREIFVNNIVKHKINYSIGPTSMYEGFLDEELIKGKKVKHYDNPVQGGEAMYHEVKTKIEGNIEKMGTKTKIIVAYGQCECGAQATSTSKKINHPANSVGIPIPGVIVTIVDDDFNELPYGTRGNIVVNTPCGMLEYYKKPEATEAYFHYDEYGRKWSCTGDIGYMGPNGDLFVEGRKSDYTIVDGKLVYNFDIESSIREMKDIKNCDCIGRLNEDNTRDLGLHIILNDTFKDKYSNEENLIERLKEIQTALYDKFQDITYVPKYFKIRDSFPYKPSGKRDIEELSNETEGFIFVDNKYLINSMTRKKRI